jgi:two-component sensor histidine kinase
MIPVAKKAIRRLLSLSQMQEHLLTGAKSTRINFTDMSFAQQLMKKLN